MTTIELFLSPGDEGGQTLRRGLGEHALAHTGAAAATPEIFPDPGGDQQSLADQGWGVVIADTETGDRLLDVVRPLIDRRSQECGREVPIYRVKPEMTAAQTVAWRDRKFQGNQEREAIPWYLLVLGPPAEVSLEFQQVMSNGSLVGRLGFDDEADYEAYIAKILSWEKAAPGGELGRAVFAGATDGSQATTMGRELLMQPTVADARARKESGRFPVSDVIDIAGRGARVADDLLAAAAERAPSVLFSCSHGMGAPASGWPSRERQRALQGAMVVGEGLHLAGDSVRDRVFLPGGLWFLFACFGAGTPGHSAYYPWLVELKKRGEFGDSLDSVLRSLPAPGDPPFLAALPQAALANPDGPLAVIGHLDLAWSYSFNDVDKFRGAERHRRFQGMLTDMARGDRVGFALKSLLAHRAEVQTELTVAADGAARAESMGEAAPDDPARLGHRWMLHQDLDGYVLLGDPAARLPVDRAAVEAARRRAREARKQAHSAAAASAPAPAPAGAPEDAPEDEIDLETMVDIVGRVLREEATSKKLARRHGLDPGAIDSWVDAYHRAGRAALKKLREDR